MGVGVDEAGRHRQARRVQHLGRRRISQIADGGDPAVPNGHIGPVAGLSRSVDDRAAANDDVFHIKCLLSAFKAVFRCPHYSGFCRRTQYPFPIPD